MRESVASAPTRSGRREPPVSRSVAGEVLRGAEDGLGMVEGDAARLGEDEPAAAALEQVVAERRLERLQLGRQGGLREVQPPCGAGQGALRRNGVEEAEVVKVQRRHRSSQ